MPTYEYECRKCGHRFEAIQSMKDAPLTACERCDGEVRRLISGGAGLLFKGSGFYHTDYRSDSYKKRAKEEGGGRAKDGAQGGAEGAKSGGEPKGGGSQSGSDGKPKGGGSQSGSDGKPKGGE